jgi:hypothetical protein
MIDIIEQIVYAFAGILLFWAFSNALHMVYQYLLS